jgi:hypothetical protein
MSVIKKLFFLLSVVFLSSCTAKKLVETDNTLMPHSVSLIAFDSHVKEDVAARLKGMGWDIVDSINDTQYVFILTSQCTQGFFPVMGRCTSQFDAINRESGETLVWKQANPDYVMPVGDPVHSSRPGALENTFNNLIDQVETDINMLINIGFPKPIKM